MRTFRDWYFSILRLKEVEAYTVAVFCDFQGFPDTRPLEEEANGKTEESWGSSLVSIVISWGSFLRVRGSFSYESLAKLFVVGMKPTPSSKNLHWAESRSRVILSCDRRDMSR